MNEVRIIHPNCIELWSEAVLLMRWTMGLMWFSVILATGFAVLDIIQGHLGGVFFDVFVGIWALWQMERIDRWKRRRRK